MISVVLATYNEEKNIERCLKAVESFADEIIIVDGSSNDKTPELARTLGAKVIKTTNKLNFHINKQMAMDKAKGDLVLQLDADEVVDNELKRFIVKTHKEISSFTKNKDKRVVDLPVKAWWLKRKNLFLGKWLTKGGQYPDPVIRLYVNGFAKLPEKDVHEQMEVDGAVEWADGHLLHYSNPSFSDYLRKFNHYTSLRAEQLYQAKTKLSFINTISFFILQPLKTFFLLFIRHKGILDGFPGFVFALMSAIFHQVTYLKLWEQYQRSSERKRINPWE